MILLLLAGIAAADEISGRVVSVDYLRGSLVLRPDDRSKPNRKIIISRGAEFRWEYGNQNSGRAEWKSVYAGMNVKIRHQSGTASRVTMKQ